MTDLFSQPEPTTARNDYTAADIEVLEGLEPVRRRPGMYIGGTDERALHHLVSEVVDNAMDEAVAGHANRIEIELLPGNRLVVRDNGRGIPVDTHPRFPDKSALEVILTTLHSGGKFSNKSYATAGGLHGVGISVVNALSAELTVEVARNKQLYTQTYRQGAPQGPLRLVGAAPNRRGTVVSFTPDTTIFGAEARFRPGLIHRLARSKAYLFRGVEIRWSCDPLLLQGEKDIPASDVFHFPAGLGDFLTTLVKDRETVVDEFFAGEAKLTEEEGRIEWAMTWPLDEEPHASFYCNTIPTPSGGTHETGLRGALLKGFRAHAERTGFKRAGLVATEDASGGACILLSLFIPQPQFQGQTKDRLVNASVARAVEVALKDRFELWLAHHPDAAARLLDHVASRAEERLARRKAKEVQRKTATRKLRLPGKLADCTIDGRAGTEIFIVEGDSAGGSAKQARNRATQAILPLRGKILNVANATREKLNANQQLADLILALGCGIGSQFREDDLRYEKVIVMTDADVDGAHIASLLVTFFWRQMPRLIEKGHLYLAVPPLYRLQHGGKSVYARNDAHKDELIASVFKGKKPEISRFKGLGEMMPAQLKETTMDPSKRILLKVMVEHEARDETADVVERLMGNKPEARFLFIQERAAFAGELIDL